MDAVAHYGVVQRLSRFLVVDEQNRGTIVFSDDAIVYVLSQFEVSVETVSHPFLKLQFGVQLKMLEQKVFNQNLLFVLAYASKQLFLTFHQYL